MPDGSRESKASILIVEDEVIIASDLKIRLSGFGYTVCGMAASSDRALSLIEQLRPDLVMMDIVLNGKRDGIETAKIVRAQWDIPVVFLTAYADTDRLDRAKLTYPFGYLMKPFQDRDLKITVEMALYVASVDAERRKAEQALSMSEKHYRALFSSINDAILVHEIDDDGSPGHFVEVNQLACDRLGYTREELLKLTPADISTPQEFARLADNRRTLVSRDQVVFETVHKTRDNRLIPVESSVAIFHHDQRRTAVSVSRDITERKRVEAALERQLLLFSRKIETTRKPVVLNHEVEQVRETLERTIPKMVDIEFIPGHGLWKIMADPVQIRQMLINLGTNAAEAMPDGGPLIIETKNVQLNEIYAYSQLGISPGNYALLSVTDSGQGMDQDTADKIFDPFFTTKAIGQRTGLGLASVYGIVKGHGGHITCSSEIGQGTIFKVYLPAMEPAGASDLVEVGAAPPKSGTETILLVDDEEPIREFAFQALARFGYTVQTAITGEKALEIHANHHGGIDLIIIDIGRPDLGGLKCLEEILKVDQSAKILIAGDYSIEGRPPHAMARGAVGFVAKPYQLLDLLNTVRSVLDKD